MIRLTEKDHQLLRLLEQNARLSVSELARLLKTSRSTAQQRLQRLETQGVIEGYRVKVSQEFEQSQISAYVLITVEPKESEKLIPELNKIEEISVLYSVSGRVDLIAVVKVTSTNRLDKILDKIGELKGIRSTESAIRLSTKFDRR